MKKIVINEETAIDKSVDNLINEIDSENSSTKIERLKKASLDLSRKLELEIFKSAISGETSGVDQTENVKNLFKKMNLIFSGGFDYYYISPIVEKIANGESLKNKRASIDVLINENQIGKLNETIKCTNLLELINYELDGEEKNAIWLKPTLATINLISFSRTEDKGILIRQGNGEGISLTEDELTNFLSNENGEYEGLEYKTVSKPEYQVKKLKK